MSYLTRIYVSMSKSRTLLRKLMHEAEQMLQGSLSQTTRTCGRPGCRCQRGERHGPHTYLTFKTSDGRSSAVYVPAPAVADARRGVVAWAKFWELAVRIAADNRQAAVERWRVTHTRARRSHVATRP